MENKIYYHVTASSVNQYTVVEVSPLNTEKRNRKNRKK